MFALGLIPNKCFFRLDQLPVCPPCCGPQRRDSARAEGKDQAVSEQHHTHLPRVLLPIPCLPVSTHPSGAGLQLH